MLHKTYHDGDKQVALTKETAEPAEHRDHQGTSDQKRGCHPLGRGQIGAKGGHHTGNGQVDAVASKGLRGTGQQHSPGDEPPVIGGLAPEPDHGLEWCCVNHVGRNPTTTPRRGTEAL
jgi:hypothetical protein